MTVPPHLPQSYQRSDLTYVGTPITRPSNEEYDKYISLALLLREKKYDDSRIYPTHPFKVKDKVFSSILYLANQRLKKMAQILGEDTSEIDSWLERFQQHFLAKLWNNQEKFFCDFDLNSNQQLVVRTVGALLPLMTGLLTKKQLGLMTRHLDHSNFCGTSKCAVNLAPSTGIEEEHFHPMTYWRGPVWLNVNWLLWKGFLFNHLTQRARHLKRHMIELVAKHGFYEYYNPLTGEGLGAKNFSWTAALIIDLLHEHS